MTESGIWLSPFLSLRGHSPWGLSSFQSTNGEEWPPGRALNRCERPQNCARVDPSTHHGAAPPDTPPATLMLRLRPPRPGRPAPTHRMPTAPALPPSMLFEVSHRDTTLLCSRDAPSTRRKPGARAPGPHPQYRVATPPDQRCDITRIRTTRGPPRVDHSPGTRSTHQFRALPPTATSIHTSTRRPRQIPSIERASSTPDWRDLRL